MSLVIEIESTRPIFFTLIVNIPEFRLSDSIDLDSASFQSFLETSPVDVELPGHDLRAVVVLLDKLETIILIGKLEVKLIFVFTKKRDRVDDLNRFKEVFSHSWRYFCFKIVHHKFPRSGVLLWLFHSLCI